MRRIPGMLLVGFFAISTGGTAAVRTFVSTAGTDNLTCSRVNPCRTFNAGIAAVDEGGEVVALDSGGYGPFLIDKSVSVIAPSGIHAAIASTGGDAVHVAAGPDDQVTVRNLNLTLLGALDGIKAQQFGQLYIDDCNIANADAVGISIETASGGQRAFISDTEVRGSLQHGIMTGSSAGYVSVTISRTRSNSNLSDGIMASSRSIVTCIDCEAGGNFGHGFSVFAASDTQANLQCERCVASSNGSDGFHSSAVDPGRAYMILSRCSAFTNLYGFRSLEGGRMYVLPGSNTLLANATDRVGAVFASTADFP